MPFDNLEYISIQNQSTDFPKHYHETFCISLVKKGIEQMDFDQQSLFTEAGTISITNPYEVHSNPLISSKNQLDFETIYISNDLMKYLFGGKNITLKNRQISSQKANQLFNVLKQAIDTHESRTIETALHQFAEILKHHSKTHYSECLEPDFENLNPIKSYINNQISDKFSLDELAKMANINKFGFSRKFKALTGMTPMNYILMHKIFSSKKLINKNSELTDIAYDYNFTDMAHFSKTFKRYVGLSPQNYQESLA